MNFNRTELCEECNSHMVSIKTQTHSYYECSYCGAIDTEFIPIENEEENEEIDDE